MADAVHTYQVRRSGIWNKSHHFSLDGKELGLLRVQRKGLMVRTGTYTPEKGEVLTMRRDPGLLRSQFSLWTDRQEWLGSSLRWSFMGREIVLHTGSRPLRMLPLPSMGFGWTLMAPRTGEMARILARPGSSKATIEVFRKVDFELVVFTYFLGVQILPESFWARPRLASDSSPRAAATS